MTDDQRPPDTISFEEVLNAESMYQSFERLMERIKFDPLPEGANYQGPPLPTHWLERHPESNERGRYWIRKWNQIVEACR